MIRRFRFLFTFAIFLIFGLSALAPSLQRVQAAAPGVVTNVVPTPGDRQITLTWSNPASVDFTGTMVRYSTSAFPTTTSDGTLAADVDGSPSGTSSTTVTGLTNGATYYFSLFSHNSAPEYSAAVNTQQIAMAVAFTEDFQSLTAPATVEGQNGWDIFSATWNVLDTAGEKTLISGGENAAFNTYRVSNGGVVPTYSNQMLRVDWRGNAVATAGQVYIKAQSTSADAGGYLLWQSGGLLRLSYATSGGGTMTNLATSSFTQVANTWYTYEISVVNNSAGLPVITAFVWQRGTAKPSTPTIQVTDTIGRHAQGVFTLGKSGTVLAEYDNVSFHGMIGLSSLLATPTNEGNALTWTNPTHANYAGAMVRSSTSAYPTSISDGSLVANVAGSSAGTSSTTHTGLTNGTRYYYTIFPYDTSGVYGAPIRISQVAYPLLFTENFTSLNTGVIAGQNNWSTFGGTWTVTDLSGNRVVSGSDTSLSYPTNKTANGNAEATDQTLTMRFLGDNATNTAGYVWLRQQDDGSGYIIWHNGNLWTISYRTASTLTTLAAAAATAAPPMEANVWFNLEVTMINSGGVPVISAYVWKQGMEKPSTPTVTATDSIDRWPEGKFALGKNNTAVSYYDDVAFYGSAPLLTITSPAAAVEGAPDVATRAITDEGGTFYIPYIQTSTTLNVATSLGTTAGGVEFVLNEGLGSEQAIIDLSSPYTAAFVELAKGEYTIDAYLLQEDGITRFVDSLAHDERTDVGIGDIINVIGDSIVEGLGGTVDGGTVTSWLDADVGTVSVDNRNFPQHGINTGTYNESFLTDLNDKLSAYYGYPVFLMNEGRGGIRASNYQSTVMTAGWQTRQSSLGANKWLIMLGINDNRVSDSAATFTSNITSLMNTFMTTYGATADNIWFAYPLYDNGSGAQGAFAPGLATYLPAVDSVRASLELQGGADLYNTMQNYLGSEYSDNVHPNAAGYVRVARLNFLSMIKPTISSATLNGRNLSLAWNELASSEATVAGYRINYGTNSTSLDSVATATSATSATINGLGGGPYYFSVEAYDNDANDISYSDDSDVTAAFTFPSSGSGSSSGSSTTAPTLVTFAVSDEAVTPGESVVLSWTTNGADVAGLDYASDGVTFIEIQRNLSANGSMTWTVPSMEGEYVVRVRPYGGSTAYDGGTMTIAVEADPQEDGGGSVSEVSVGQSIRSPYFSTVYYIDEGLVRRPYLDAQTYFTYNDSFDAVDWVTDATLPELPIGTPMLPQPGTVLVKIQSDDRVYWLEQAGDVTYLRWIEAEEVARELFGDTWAEYVIDVPPTMMTYYSRGTSIDASSDINPDLLLMKTRASLAR